MKNLLLPPTENRKRLCKDRDPSYCYAITFLQVAQKSHHWCHPAEEHWWCSIYLFLYHSLWLLRTLEINQTSHQVKLHQILTKLMHIYQFSLPGKNPGENLWNETVITLDVAQNASSTPEKSVQWETGVDIIVSLTSNLTKAYPAKWMMWLCSLPSPWCKSRST